MAGHYEFGEEPPDMWCRHDNCRCEIVYANGYKVQSLRGTKKSWDIKTDHSYEEYRAKQPDKKTTESAEKYEPKTLTREQAAQAEAAGLAKYANALDFSAGSGIMDKGIKVDMQYFSEKDIERQESNSLKRAIRNYKKRIKEHEEYISNPYEHCPDWDSFDDRKKEGLIRHWKKEISNFDESIQNRVTELKKRGDYDE